MGDFFWRLGFLTKIAFYVVRFGQHKTPFRVHIYESEYHQPGRDLLTENLIAHANAPNSYCTVDVEKYNIPFPKEGLFISMEWLNMDKKKYYYTVKYKNSNSSQIYFGQQIGLTNEFEDLMGYVRINNGAWKKMTAGFASPMFKAKVNLYED